MAFNWGSIGSTLAGVSSAIANAGVAVGSTSWHSILASIGLAQNPNQSEELALCSQILVVQSNPPLVAALAQKLATEQGIPPAAATLAMQFMQPGADVSKIALEIETIIRQGG